ncbi:MAG: hypothetical protein JWN78_1435 [Bacteroidota bacterium]|nr:hypothetical protein [Bacteroidota bacterium]
MNKIFQIATNISTPLMLAGFFAAAFFFIARQIIKANIFPQLTKQLSSDIIKIIIERLFVLALTAMILGFVGYIVTQFNPAYAASEKTKAHYEMPSNDLIRFALEDITAVDFGPQPETKNLTFNFKVIPKSKDKYVPLKTKGELITIDSVGKEKVYSFNVNFDEQGIKPQVISYITLDGLIPRQDYEKIKVCNNFKAKCVFYYDNDIINTDQKFTTKIFSLRNIINDMSR